MSGPPPQVIFIPTACIAETHSDCRTQDRHDQQTTEQETALLEGSCRWFSGSRVSPPSSPQHVYRRILAQAELASSPRMPVRSQSSPEEMHFLPASDPSPHRRMTPLHAKSMPPKRPYRSKSFRHMTTKNFKKAALAA